MDMDLSSHDCPKPSQPHDVSPSEARQPQESATFDSLMQEYDWLNRASLILEAARVGTWEWDVSTPTVVWNHHHELLWGYVPGTPERTFEEWQRQVHPEDLPEVLAAIQSTLRTGVDFSCEYRVIWDDGSVHWISAIGQRHVTPAVGAKMATEEPSYHMIGIVQDITHRKTIEAQLQLSEERLRLATEAADVGMWFWDLRTQELVWTNLCKQLFGLPLDAPITYEIFLEALHPDDRERTHAAVMKSHHQKMDYEIEYRSLWPNGEVHWLLAKGRTFYNATGEPIRMMGTVQDITCRKQTEIDLQERSRELQETNRLLLQATTLVNQRNQELDQFVHIISHDLKAPLRGITHLSEWIEEDLADAASPDVQQNLALLRSRVARMDAMITGLLDYARVSYQQTSCETFALADVLEEIVNSLHIPAEFTVDIPPDLPTLTTNRLLLDQVLTNLISNAVKHHDRPNGRVTIRAYHLTCDPSATSQYQPGYEIVVQDDGPGINPKHHERIFGIFQTLSSEHTKESTGVGLAIVRRILERMGGTISLESNLGQGTTFRFTWFVNADTDQEGK